ncbi:MAG: hypothetical protein Kow0074_19780 [Candidatus Zixiibacteriota bacterium]
MERNMGQGYRTRKIEKTFARRRRLLIVVALCVWGAIWLRAFDLQILNRATLSDVADRQSGRRVRLVAPRGEILDRRGRILALNVGTESFFAYPGRESSARDLAAKFATVCRTSSAQLRRKWSEREDKFTWMVRRCDEDLARRIRAWNLPGVHATSEFTRKYPCTIPGVKDPIGYVNADLAGAAGLEVAYDRLLRGTDGEGVLVADAVGRRFDLDPIPIKPLQPGINLHTTIDWDWQSILAEELAAAVKKWKAKSGQALLMNPHTGAIIALVDYDPFNAHAHRSKIRLVTDVMEPGSTFKIVPFAAALSDGVIGPRSYYDCGDGKGRFSNRYLRDDKKHGVLSADEIFIVSSNVGTGRIANELAPGRLEFWCRRFGFGTKTGIDLEQESNGRIAQQPPSEINLATLSIGHGIAATPLQLARAYAVVANGGYLVRPHLVAATETPDGRIAPTPIQAERILSPEVALRLKDMMRRVVREGTAEQIWDPEYPIAGKTGTAEKPDLERGRYDKNSYLASFVGFYPADNPRLLGLIVLDEPEPVHYGGWTAAPVLLNTIKRGVNIDDSDWKSTRRNAFSGPVAKAHHADDWARTLVGAVAPLVTVAEAQASDDQNETVVAARTDYREQAPSSVCETIWESIDRTRRVADTPDEGHINVWPDLRGMSLRDALATARALGAQIRVTGSGLVTDQIPPPGTTVKTEQQCQLTLQ